MNLNHTVTRVASVVTLVLRILLGAMFVYAAIKKLGDPQAFAFAIKGFQVPYLSEPAGEPLTVLLAFVMPWTELLAGLGLILGFWTRASSLVIGALLVGFIGGLLGVIFRPELSASCSCFGDIDFICGSTVGWCHVIRNVVLISLTAVTFVLGGGLFSIDGLVVAARESFHGPALGLGQGADALDSDD
ncbi:MAG: putative oxidoreductase [Phycisphaerales bacterium]